VQPETPESRARKAGAHSQGAEGHARDEGSFVAKAVHRIVCVKDEAEEVRESDPPHSCTKDHKWWVAQVCAVQVPRRVGHMDSHGQRCKKEGQMGLEEALVIV